MTTGPEEAPKGTRAIRKSSELMITAASMSPKRTWGRRRSVGRRSLPLMRTSPPGKAALGCTAEMCGLPFVFFLPSNRSEIPMYFKSVSETSFRENAEMKKKLHDGQRVKPRAHVIYYD